ncbi:MAG: hypothetical protein ACHQEM_10455, partial [Chitinophagales bacterium]
VPIRAQKPSQKDSLKLQKTVAPKVVDHSGAAIPTDGTSTNSNGDLVGQINAQYNSMEQNIELEFAKLSAANHNQSAQLKGVNERLSRQNDSLTRKIQQLQTVGSAKAGSKPENNSSKNNMNQLSQQIAQNNQQININQSKMNQLNKDYDKLKADKQKNFDALEEQRKMALKKAPKR